LRRPGLSNPIYVGKVVHKGEPYRGLHEAIIGRDTWDPVRRRWFTEIREGAARSVRELAASHDVDRTDVGRGVSLAFLAPDIVEAIVDGRPAQAGARFTRVMGGTAQAPRVHVLKRRARISNICKTVVKKSAPRDGRRIRPEIAEYARLPVAPAARITA